jgi:hypothetical protein
LAAGFLIGWVWTVPRVNRSAWIRVAVALTVLAGSILLTQL